MTSSIYLSRKAEKAFGKKLLLTENYSDNRLGKWNTQLFFHNRKKWLLLTHGETRFSFFVKDINAQSIKNINELLFEGLYQQLLFEGIEINREKLLNIVGEFVFHTTDNDRRITGTQNTTLGVIEYWKVGYVTVFETIGEMGRIINESPTEAFKWKSPKEMMIIKVAEFDLK